jgi:SEC-C motif
VDVPAFCDTCGAVFRSGIAVDNSTNITFVGNRAGPCPVCGGMGHIPDGVFNFVGNTIEILSAPQRTVDELSRLATILREAREKKRSPEEVAQTIRKELPELSGLADLLPKTRAELYAFLALIVAVVALLSQSGGGDSKSTNITVNQTINQVFIETEKVAKSPEKAAQSPNKAVPKVGRNDPCPCGSGKKFKKCCGRVQ